MKRSNWIYKYYKLSNDRYEPEYVDICTLGRGCIETTFFGVLGVIGILFIGSILGLFLVGLAEIGLNLFSIGSFMYYFGMFGNLGISTVIGVGVLLCIIIILIAAAHMPKTRNNSVIYNAYRSFKDRACYLIKLED